MCVIWSGYYRSSLTVEQVSRLEDNPCFLLTTLKWQVQSEGNTCIKGLPSWSPLPSHVGALWHPAMSLWLRGLLAILEAAVVYYNAPIVQCMALQGIFFMVYAFLSFWDMRLNSQLCVKSLNSALTNWKPLSEMATSGIPCVANIIDNAAGGVSSLSHLFEIWKSRPHTAETLKHSSEWDRRLLSDTVFLLLSEKVTTHFFLRNGTRR